MRQVQFCVEAADGRQVTLYKDTYYRHILDKRPEIAQLQHPIVEIERALVQPVTVRPSDKAGSTVYIGPPVNQMGFLWTGACLYVYVKETGVRTGVVTTVVRRLAGA